MGWKRRRKGSLIRQLRNTKRYRDFRDRMMGENPVCEDPYGVHRTPVIARELHHKVPMSVDVLLAMHPDNVERLCRRCHQRRDGEVLTFLNKEKLEC